MKMNDYLTALQTHLTTQQSPNQSILVMLATHVLENISTINAELMLQARRLVLMVHFYMDAILQLNQGAMWIDH